MLTSCANWDGLDIFVEARTGRYHPGCRATWGWDGGSPAEAAEVELDIVRVVVDDGQHPQRELDWDDLPTKLQAEVWDDLQDRALSRVADERECADELRAEMRREGGW